MDGVSGAFAVVSLAIQLFETVQETSKFVKEIKNAPSDLIKLGETLEQLASVLGHVKQLLEQQLLVLRLPGSPIFISDALQNCERRLKPLDEIVDRAKEACNDYRAIRMWNSLKFVLKKEQLQELQAQLRDAKFDLQFAVSTNSWQLQMHHLKITNGLALLNVDVTEKQPPAEHLNDAVDCNPPRHKQPLSLITRETDKMWYEGVLGSVRIHKKSKSSSHSSTTRPNQKGLTIEEDVIMIQSSFLRRGFELRFFNSFGRISRSLNIYPVMMEQEPIFRMCQRGDIEGIRVAFDGGSLSPFVLDNYGRTLLHHAATYFHSDLCTWLLQLGVNPDTWSATGQTALQRVAIPGVCDEYEGDLTSFAKPIVDTLRVLSQAQTDFSPADMERFTRLYSGPPLGVEFLLLQHTNLAGIQDQDDKEMSAYAFATAVSLFGIGILEWEHIIRKLIHEGIDIHGRVRRNLIDPWYAIHEDDGTLATLQVLGTPLDELFDHTNTPFEAQTTADSWLRILASEGFDVLAYLKKEIALHTTQQLLTWSTHWCRRQLIFQLGENPGFWWDWQLDPTSSALLVRETYKSMNSMKTDDFSDSYSNSWPFGYPDWYWSPWYSDDMPESERDHALAERERRKNLAEQRANRRMAKKASKLRHALRKGRPSRMPGAWPL